MGLIGTTVAGPIAGPAARFLKSGDDSIDWIITVLLGIGGSPLVTYGGQAIGLYQADQAAGFIGTVVGVVVLLIIYGLIKKN